MQVNNMNNAINNVVRNVEVYSTKNLYGERKFVKQLSAESKYNYCPYCVSRVKRGNLDYKAELKPLTLERWKFAMRLNPTDPKDGMAKIFWEDKLVCGLCKDEHSKPKEITPADFENVYCVQNKIRNAYVNLFDKNEMEHF